MTDSGTNTNFASGASGVITSLVMMRAFVDSSANLAPTGFHCGNPGLLFASFLNIKSTTSTTTQEAFHVYPPSRIASGDFDSWYVTKKPNSISVGDSYTKTSERRVVSFHYMSALETRALYELLILKSYSDGADVETLIKRYPRKENGGEAKGLCGYSKNPNVQMIEYLIEYVIVG